MLDDPLFNDDLPLNEPFEDLPARNKPPLQDKTSIHHPLINGAYTAYNFLRTHVQVDDAAC